MLKKIKNFYYKYIGSIKINLFSRRLDSFTTRMTMMSYYSYAMNAFDTELNLLKETTVITLKDEIDILASYMQLIKNDLATSKKIGVLYSDITYGTSSPRVHDSLFPIEYVVDTDYTINKTLAVDTYISTWRLYRFNRILKYIRKLGFEEKKINHKAKYYQEIDLLHVYNGKHSATAGTLQDNSSITATVVSIAPMFDKVFTDGARWYILENNKKRYLKIVISDFRIAILYTLGYRKFKLEQQDNVRKGIDSIK